MSTDYNYIAYRHVVLAIPKDVDVSTEVMDLLRRIFFSNLKFDILYNKEIIVPENVFYRIPCEHRYINNTGDILELSSDAKAKQIEVFPVPQVIKHDDYEIILKPRDAEELQSYAIGNYSYKHMYKLAKYKVYIPNQLIKLTGDIIIVPDNIKRWYKNIEFVFDNNGYEVPILVGDDISFAKYPDENGDIIELGVSPEYPNITITKLHADDLERSKLSKLLSERYRAVYKYMIFSSTMPKDILSGYIMLPITLNHDGIQHMEITGFGRNLEGVDPLYLISSALYPGRTKNRPAIKINVDDHYKLRVKWQEGSNVRGRLRLLEYGDDFIRKIK